MIASRRRGRPKYKELRQESIEKQRIEEVKAEIVKIMNQPINYEVLLTFDWPAEEYKRTPPEDKKSAPTLMDKLVKEIGEEAADAIINFKKHSEKLRSLLSTYQQLKEKQDRPSSDDISKSRMVELMEEDNLFEEDVNEENEEKIIETPPKNCRTTLLKLKAPLKSFMQEGFQKLDEEGQNLLQDHTDEIFAPEVVYQEQVELVINLLYEDYGPSAIGRLFGVTRGTIFEHRKRMQKRRRELLGRPGLLNEEELKILILFIKTSFDEKRPADYADLVNFAFKNFNVAISTDSMAHIIRRTPKLKAIVGHPMEAARNDVDVSIIITHYEKLDAILISERVPPQFFFNVDESGFQEFVNAHDTIVVVPSDYNDDEITFSVNREGKRASMIGCIAMDGTALKPLVISPNKTIETAMIKAGYNDANCFIVSQDKGFVNAEIFAVWADYVFFPELKRRRIQYNYKGTAILTMDGCSCHFSDYVLDECTYHGTYPVQEPAGTSDQVQPLDLGIFGIQKALKSKEKVNIRGISANSKHLIQIMNSWHKATTPSNVVSAFEQAGFYLEDLGDNQFMVRASAEKARAVRGIEHKENCIVCESKKSIKLNVF